MPFSPLNRARHSLNLDEKMTKVKFNLYLISIFRNKLRSKTKASRNNISYVKKPVITLKDYTDTAL